jgi:hypothetical protein
MYGKLPKERQRRGDGASRAWPAGSLTLPPGWPLGVALPGPPIGNDPGHSPCVSWGDALGLGWRSTIPDH